MKYPGYGNRLTVYNTDMAYTRWNESGHYIYGGAGYVDFNGIAVPDDEVDIFIYRLFSERGESGDEFQERYDHGKRVAENFQKGIRIRKLWKHAPDDLETYASAIAVLADEIWREHYTPIIGVAQVDYMLAKFQSAEQVFSDIRNNGYTYFIAKDTKEDRSAGYCAVVPQDDYLFLSKIYVHRDYRGKGIAWSFLGEIIALCRWEYGFNIIRLTVNKHNAVAIAAYRQIGFTIIDSVKTDIGNGFFMDDYVMEINCTPA